MIIDGTNRIQRGILANKRFYQTTAQIMADFENKGYPNSADETAKVIAAYHDIVQHKAKNTYNPDYNEAFKKIDDAIADMAHKVFYDCDKKSYFTMEGFLISGNRKTVVACRWKEQAADGLCAMAVCTCRIGRTLRVVGIGGRYG